MSVTLDGQHILAAILADPADDLPRLAYADWLEENGDDARAEFIRVQVGLARWRDDDVNESLSPGGIKRHAALQRRELTSWDCRWLAGSMPSDWAATIGALPKDHPCVLVQRGFIHTVRCPLAAWQEHGPALVRAHPIERVELSDKKPQPLGVRYPSDRKPAPQMWQRGSHDLERVSREVPSSIWAPIFDVHPCAKNPGTKEMAFKDKNAAAEALTLMCLLWAKEEAIRRAALRHPRPAD